MTKETRTQIDAPLVPAQPEPLPIAPLPAEPEPLRINYNFIYSPENQYNNPTQTAEPEKAPMEENQPGPRLKAILEKMPGAFSPPLNKEIGDLISSFLVSHGMSLEALSCISIGFMMEPSKKTGMPPKKLEISTSFNTQNFNALFPALKLSPGICTRHSDFDDIITEPLNQLSMSLKCTAEKMATDNGVYFKDDRQACALKLGAPNVRTLLIGLNEALTSETGLDRIDVDKFAPIPAIGH